MTLTKIYNDHQHFLLVNSLICESVIVMHCAENVRHGAKNVYHGAKNVLLVAKNCCRVPKLCGLVQKMCGMVPKMCGMKPQSPNAPIPQSPGPPIPQSPIQWNTIKALERPTDGWTKKQANKNLITRQSPQFLGLCKKLFRQFKEELF